MKSLHCPIGRRLKAHLCLVILLVYFLASTFSPSYTYATATSCDVSVDPTSVKQNETSDITFTITNNDATNYDWVKITRPNFRFSLVDGTATDWSDEGGSSAITFTGGTIDASESHDFIVTQTTANTEANAANWIVQVSDDGGSTVANCTGSTGVAITAEWGFPVQQNNVTVSNLTATTATITWTTNRPSSSELHYGLTENYGSAIYDSDFTQSHSHTIEGLDPGTTYYYYAVNVDGDSNTAEHSDQFTTEEESSNPATTPTISNVSVTGVTSSSVTITWTTDVASDSVVKYDTNTNYSLTVSNDSLTTSHSIEVSDLSASTTYHYRLESTSASDLTGTTSSDNTFTTSAATSTTTPTPTPTTTPTPTRTPTPTGAPATTSTPTPITPVSASGTPTPTLITTTITPIDTTIPVVTITTNLTKPFTTTLPLSAKVIDTTTPKSIEYSIDSGKNWLPVEKVTNSASESTATFTPKVSEDGNYEIKVRATDDAGNTGVSSSKTLIIDRFPPTVGGSVLSLGSQEVYPASNGTIIMMKGLDQKITLSSIGGATSVDLKSVDTDQTFSLAKSKQSGLWSGAMSFSSSGTFKVSVRSMDGAGHVIERDFSTVVVLPNGKVTDENNNGISNAKVTLYYEHPITHLWTVWDASAYGQSNPLTTNNNGEFFLYIPQGKYYLRVEAPHFRSVTSNIFTINKATPITASFQLNPSFTISLGTLRFSLPELFTETTTINLSSNSILNKESSLINRKVPKFSLQTTNNQTATNITGKKHLITLLSSWSASSLQQLKTLDAIHNQIEGHIISVGENKTKINLLQRRGKYTTPIVIDSEMVLPKSFQLNSLPSHYFVGEDGIIKKVVIGNMNEKEILEIWNQL